MSVRGPQNYAHTKFIVIGKRRLPDSPATSDPETRYWPHSGYTDAVSEADLRTKQGYGCVVVDLEQRRQVYENNPSQQASNVPAEILPKMQYLNFERRQLEGEALRDVPQPRNMEEFKQIMNAGRYWPRASGQTPADGVKDYAG